MIGTGIFGTTGYLAGQLGSPQLILWIWAVGGVCALAGAISYSELALHLPQLRRRIRLSDRSLRSHLGLYDRMDLVFRGILRAHRGLLR